MGPEGNGPNNESLLSTPPQEPGRAGIFGVDDLANFLGGGSTWGESPILALVAGGDRSSGDPVFSCLVELDGGGLDAREGEVQSALEGDCEGLGEAIALVSLENACARSAAVAGENSAIGDAFEAADRAAASPSACVKLTTLTEKPCEGDKTT